MKKYFLSIGIIFIFSSAGAQNSFASLCDNKNNHLNLPVEDIQLTDTLVKQIMVEDSAAIMNRLGSKELKLHEAGICFYYLGERLLEKKTDYEQAFRFFGISADIYINPVAKVKMARAFYHGIDGVIEKDIDKSYFLINEAFQIVAGIPQSHPGCIYGQLVVSNGLPLFDTLTSMKSVYDPSKKTIKQAYENAKSVSDEFNKLYKLI
ncbi:MAG TPA: hypothetical protein VFJ43_01130 [Bacteroidia bacterium]|nr:hypothetical protein [Bacteroidia bacterium]